MNCYNNCIKWLVLENCPKLLSTKELLDVLKNSNQTLYKYRQEIDFPEPIRLSSRNFRWKLDEVAYYLEKRKLV